MKQSKQDVIKLIREKTNTRLKNFTNRDVFRGYLAYKVKQGCFHNSIADVPRMDFELLETEIKRVAGNGFCTVK